MIITLRVKSCYRYCDANLVINRHGEPIFAEEAWHNLKKDQR
ncbi:protein of unknown function [Candidatus Methylacidiphilum fumarolicum]|uniref:Uncharacterized protein n=1 Tax=Candidatus Methylacidiphilum fumarolicum TaxID=591154 RepID=A0ABM9IBV5_9BACT|nr:protein of unknown function [Candidatus Methylacidiphilum fumarolicum]